MSLAQRPPMPDPSDRFRMPGISLEPAAQDRRDPVQLPMLAEQTLPVEVARMNVPDTHASMRA